MAGLPNSNLSHEAKRGSTLRAKDTDILIAYLLTNASTSMTPRPAGSGGSTGRSRTSETTSGCGVDGTHGGQGSLPGR